MLHGRMSRGAALPGMEFWGASIEADGLDVAAGAQGDGRGVLSTVHITNVALGDRLAFAKELPVTVYLETRDGARHTLGTLEPGKCEQFQVDITVPTAFRLSHTGRGFVSVTGVKTTTVLSEPPGAPPAHREIAQDRTAECSWSPVLDARAPAGKRAQRCSGDAESSDWEIWGIRPVDDKETGGADTSHTAQKVPAHGA
ncbi:unnamed protein product [Pedinophyceae sp. YPF-701]|nr:unnamed protein product [Pedinophyceae sp. YPF-701]